MDITPKKKEVFQQSREDYANDRKLAREGLKYEEPTKPALPRVTLAEAPQPLAQVDNMEDVKMTKQQVIPNQKEHLLVAQMLADGGYNQAQVDDLTAQVDAMTKAQTMAKSRQERA